MSEVSKSKHKEGSSQVENIMNGVIENLFISHEKIFIADTVHRDAQGTRIFGVMLDGGVRHMVSFSLSNAHLPPGEYEFPGDKIADIYYMTVQPGFPEMIYRAQIARLTIRENTSEPYLAGDLVFDTETVDSFHYQVRISNFEITGQTR